MSLKNLSTVGIYATATQAEVGVDMLIAKGFKSGEISVLLPEHPNNQPATHGAPGTCTPAPQTTKAGSASAIGATAGGALGGALALLVGAGALAIPGVGPFVAAGPLMAGLAGLGVGGAVGGLGGALVGMGLHEDEVKRYLNRIGSGHTMLVVHCDTPAEVLKAKGILTLSGAAEVSVGNQPITV